MNLQTRITAITALLLAGTCFTEATELRTTQFPPSMPKAIIVAGAEYAAAAYLKPWIEPNPANYAGKYHSVTITDGAARLEVKMREEKTVDGSVRWHADGHLVTSIGDHTLHTLSFARAEVMEPHQPSFDVIDRVTPALFVLFTDPEKTGAAPRKGVVIGDQVYIKE
jgi:hypothetical protein